MAITDRHLAPGTKLVATYKKATRTCEVVETTEGLRYRLDDGREFKSPSGAGAAIMGEGRTCNGYSFWSRAEGEATGRAAVRPSDTPKSKRSRRRADVEPSEASGTTLPIIEQLTGEYECGNCGSAFATRDEVEAHLAEVHPGA